MRILSCGDGCSVMQYRSYFDSVVVDPLQCDHSLESH